MNATDLHEYVRRWLDEVEGSADAAAWLLHRAARTGALPQRLTLPADDANREALAQFFSARYLRPINGGQRLVLHLQRWAEQARVDRDALAEALAGCTGLRLENRRQQRLDRQRLLADLLQPHASAGGLLGHVAQREHENIAGARGRLWSRTRQLATQTIEREVDRYLRLLRHVDELLERPDRVVRMVHLSRLIAGDSHWLRPGNRVCRDLADDLVGYAEARDDARAPSADGSSTPAWHDVLADAGVVENLTSVCVLLFGRVALESHRARWQWPAEAAAAGLPLWLSAAQLQHIRPAFTPRVQTVITIENETSLLDLIEQDGRNADTVLIYTAGHANRAVVRLLKLLCETFPDCRFYHQGDLDLAGVRILKSLRDRTQIDIRPAHMDATTFRRFAADGIAFSAKERTALAHAMADPELPCRDLLAAMYHAGKRIEQEVITGGTINRR